MTPGKKETNLGSTPHPTIKYCGHRQVLSFVLVRICQHIIYKEVTI